MNKIVKAIYDDYSTYLSDTTEWRRRRDKMRKLYYGLQYSDDVSDKYEDRGWVDVVLNHIRPLIKTRVSTLIASKPEGKVYGVKKSDIATALALEEFIDWHWYKSDGALVAEEVLLGSQREGVSYFVVYMDNKLDYGRGELVIGSETYEHVFKDKAAGRFWDFRDASRIIHTKLIRPDEAKLRFNLDDDTIKDCLHTNDEVHWGGKKQAKDTDDIGLPESLSPMELIREFDSYQRFYRDVRILHYLPTGFIDILDDDYELTPQDKDLISQGIIREANAPVPRIRWYKCIANPTHGKLINERGKEIILPIDYYPIIPVQDERTGNAEPLGEVDFLYGKQELLNKSAALVLLNASLSSLFKIIIDSTKSGITDLTKFRHDWAAPGGVFDMKQDPVTGKFPYELVKPESLNQAFFAWMEKMAYEIEYSLSQFSLRMGDPSKAPETYSATLQLGEWAQDILRMPLNHFEIALQRLGETILQWSPHFYTDYKMFDVLRDDEPEAQFINAPFPMQAMINPKTKQVISSMNDISKIKAKYRIRTGSTMPSMATAHMMLYGELSKTDPYWRKWLVDYLPIKEKETVKQELDQLQQAMAKNQQMEQGMKMMQGELQRLYEQVIAKDKAIEITEFKKELENRLNEFKWLLKDKANKSDSSRTKK